jgi:hypothetical protein
MNTIICTVFWWVNLENCKKNNTKINSKLNIIPKLTKDLTPQAHVSDVLQQKNNFEGSKSLCSKKIESPGFWLRMIPWNMPVSTVSPLWRERSILLLSHPGYQTLRYTLLSQGCSLYLTLPHSSTLQAGKHPRYSNEINIQCFNLVITLTPQKDKYSYVIWSWKRYQFTTWIRFKFLLSCSNSFVPL